MNPSDHEIELHEEDYDDGVITVRFKFSEHKGANAFTAAELERVGKWFQALGKEVRERVKKAKAA